MSDGARRVLRTGQSINYSCKVLKLRKKALSVKTSILKSYGPCAKMIFTCEEKNCVYCLKIRFFSFTAIFYEKISDFLKEFNIIG